MSKSSLGAGGDRHSRNVVQRKVVRISPTKHSSASFQELFAIRWFERHCQISRLRAALVAQLLGMGADND